MEIFIDILAGLGLFFVGVKLIAGHLKQLSGPWFRRLIERATRSPVAAAALGLLSGALTQSSSAITFISISVVTAGLADVARVAPMVIWANVGTSVLVLLSAIDISHAVLFLLGVTGVAYYFDVDKAPRLRHLFGALLGLGLLFLGLELIKSGAAPLKEMESVRDFLSFAASSFVAAFVVGAAFAVVAQSSAMVSIIAVTMINVGILTLDQTIVIVIGASLGSGIATLLLSANLSGVGRQIGYLQVAVKTLGVLVVLPLFVAETYGLVPGIRSVVFALAADVTTQVALVYLLLQLVSAVLGTLFQRQLIAFAARLSPPTLEESLSRPRFLYAEALEDPGTALDLVEKEQGRVFARLPEIIDAVRPDGESVTAPEVLVETSLSITRQCDEFLTDILDNNQSRSVMVDVVGVQKRNEILLALISSSSDYIQAVASVGRRSEDDKLGRLLFALNESLHAILLVANDAATSRDAVDMGVLRELTSDRSTQMERIRRQVMEVEEVSPADHQALYASTTLFERLLWLTRRYALSLLANADEPGTPAEPTGAG
jgi:phosphate:Na+ symporter